MTSASIEHTVCGYSSRARCTLADLADLASLPMGAPSLLYTRTIMPIVFIFLPHVLLASLLLRETAIV